MPNRETLWDYMQSLPGYYSAKDSENDQVVIRRTDGTIAAHYQRDRWITFPTQEEMIGFQNFTGRAFPTRLTPSGFDVTNGQSPVRKKNIVYGSTLPSML